MPPRVEWGWWYQYYFATERGRAGLDANRRDLAKLIWKFNSPRRDFDDATFDRSAASFDNPDHVSIVIHNYRWRLSLAEGDTQYDDSRSDLPKVRSSQCPPSPLMVIPMALRLPRTAHLTPRSSRANARTGSLRASVTTCRRKPPEPSVKLSSKSTVIDRC